MTMNGSGSEMNRAFGRDLPLAHRLQHRRLRARRGAIDFIRKHDVGEDRPATEFEFLSSDD